MFSVSEEGQQTRNAARMPLVWVLLPMRHLLCHNCFTFVAHAGAVGSSPMAQMAQMFWAN